VFTARYALSPYIKQIGFVFKGLKMQGLATADLVRGNRQMSQLSACRPAASGLWLTSRPHANTRLVMMVSKVPAACAPVTSMAFRVREKSFISLFLRVRFKNDHGNLKGFVEGLG
jgi:hypothetical protein